MKLPRLVSRKSQLSVPQEQGEAHSAPSYKPLPNPRTQCRLLSVHAGRSSDPIICTTSVAELAEAAGRYDALSYCWGSPHRSRSINCDGQPLNVTASLESALKRLRAPDIARSFWIDQLCIDQDNLGEKQQQVRLMSDIYRHSCKVLIWLGDDGDEPRKAYKIIERLLRLDLSASNGVKNGDDNLRLQTRGKIDLDQLKSHGLPGSKDIAWQELRALLSRPWFSRIWTIQEAAVAVDADFLWGKDYTLNWEGMVTIMRLVWEHLPMTLLGSDMLLQGLPANSIYRIAATMRTLDNCAHQDLFNLALTYKAYGASKPHDKLYALLNISNSPRDVDYGKSVEVLFHEMAYHNINQVYEEITRAPEELSQQQWHPYPGIAQGPHLRMVALICAAGIAYQQLPLPSWVPDWTVDLFPAPIWTRKTSYKTRASANNSDWPGAPTADSTLERPTITNQTLAEFQWPHDTQKPIGSAGLPTMLQIKGLICDTISRRVFAKVELGKSLELEEQQKALIEWLLEADEMADLGPETSYSGGADTELFRRILLLDEEDPPKPAAGVENPELCRKALLRFMKNSRFAGSMKRKLQAGDYLRALRNIPGRTFFVTQGGRMGLAPHATHMYDKICVLPGFAVPLVLRPEGNEFRIVGECYAGNDDMMPGGLEYSQMIPEWVTIK